MKSEAHLFWEHGTLLQPQHFQVSEQQRQTQQNEIMRLTSPYAWGVKHVRIQAEALQLGQVLVEDLDLFLPTGEHIILGANAIIQTRNIHDLWPHRDEALIVYAGLAVLQEQSANVSVCPNIHDAHSFQTRFVANQDPVVVFEKLAGGEAADVRFMYYNVQLLFSSEPQRLQSMPSVPIAKLIQKGESIVLDESYVPPCLNIMSFPLLQNAFKATRNAVLARARQLDDFKLPSGTIGGSSGQAVVTMHTLALHSMLQVLCRYAPLLDHCCDVEQLHPWTAYGLLRQVVGELSLFSPDVSVLGQARHGQVSLPPYNHQDLGPCFRAAQSLIATLVDLLAAGPAHSFEFEKHDPFWTCLIPDHARRGFEYWLQIRSSNAAFLQQLHQSGLRFAPLQVMPDLVARSLPGIPLFAGDPPPGLPRREDTVYLRLESADTLWTEIQKNGEAALFLPQAPEETVVHLILMTSIARYV